MKHLLMALALTFPLSGMTNIDLDQFQFPSEKINGVQFPRQITEGSILYKDTKYVLRNMIQDVFNDKKPVLISNLQQAIIDKLQDKRVEDDLYDYMYDTGLIDEIKNFNKTGNDLADSESILRTYLSKIAPQDFLNDILKDKVKVADDFLITLVADSSRRMRDDYVSINYILNSHLFDLSFFAYKSGVERKVYNDFVSIEPLKNIDYKNYTRHHANGDVRYTIEFDEIDNKTYGIVFNSNDELIGLITDCDKNTVCAVKESVWDLFPVVAKEDISSRDEYEIEEVDIKGKTVFFEKPLVKISGGSFSSKIAINDAKFSELNKIAAKDADYQGMKVRKIYTDVTIDSPLSITYTFDNSDCRKAARGGEDCLELGEAIYMRIPDQFQNIPIENITVAHRQNTKDNRGRDSFDSRTGRKEMDAYPGFAAVQVYDASYPYKFAWRFWGGHVSGHNGGKYSEHKDNGSWEFDNLYEWPLYGHRPSHQSQKSSQKPLYGKYIRVFADTGKNNQIIDYDKTYVYSVNVQFVQKVADVYDTWSFTNSKTDLGDPQTMQGRYYGGGPKYQGLYPGAIRLHPKKRMRVNENGWTGNRKKGEIEIDAKVGMKLQSVEIAAGDTHPDQKPNKDGGIGSAGGARLSVVLETRKGSIVLVDKANLGPKGVIKGVPTNLDYTIQSGDKVRVYAEGDYAYIMGARIGYDK